MTRRLFAPSSGLKMQLLQAEEWRNAKRTLILRRVIYASAITSISTDTSFGRRATSTVERAGGAFLQVFPYTSFICPNSDMLFRKTVVFTTFSQLLPAACRIAERFFNTCSVCSSIQPSIMFPVSGSMGICPEIKRNPLALMACEYGPIALGALGVETTSRVKPLMKPSENLAADFR